MISQVVLRGVGPRARAALATALGLSVAVLLALPRPARATVFLSSADQGSWTAADKELHAAGSLAIAASIRVTGRSEAESFTAAVSVGVLKEIYDATLKPAPAKRGASWKDLVADVLGAAAGVLLVHAME
jgi:uncharacterized protein YfiM (DUF2279 family)